MEKTQAKLEIVLKYFADFTPRQLEQLTALDGLYADWNSKINVISRKDIGSLYEKHVLHSLGIAAVAPFADGTRIIDIGTGGGFPGIPLAIFYPGVEFFLVDSIGKKLKVVEAVRDALELKNLKFKHARAEEIPGGQFDIAVSRAVAPLGDLWRWAAPLLRKGKKGEVANSLFCLKGGDLAKEIHDSGLRPLAWELSSIYEEEYFKEKYVLQVKV